MPMNRVAALALMASLGLGDGALAQSTGAPVGPPAATAPGGDEGRAGPANERRAIEDGAAVPAAPGVGVPVEGRLPGAVPGEPVPPPPPPRP